MNCRTVPVLNRLDHDPRDEFEDETDGVRRDALGEGIRAQANEIGLAGIAGFFRLK
jgi:hypothetical protein